ncbi:MAG: DNA-binding response regulator [Lysobacteraceae bacterium]|nr:MAG: DNA-binding response regulator [Xanthomonadaceae bacterium]
MEVSDRKILVVEDEPDIANLVALHLRDNQFEVRVAADGATGLSLATNEQFDLVILDLRLPRIDGLSICRELRKNNRYLPIMMLTAKSSELDRVLGLELGADDYVTKPFSVTELVARTKAIFRRIDAIQPRSQVQQGLLSVGPIILDQTRRSVRVHKRPVDLTAREFDLLAHFARHPGHVFSRAQLLDQVWGYGHDGYEHTVNSHINRLRAKIERDTSQPKHIVTVWGVGYKLEATATPLRVV